VEEIEKRGRQASINGFAHEHIVAGILMKRYHNVSLVDLPLSRYDVIVVLKKREKDEIIRAQVKTAKKSINFTGGTRGGIDRVYRSGIKEYVQSTKSADIVIGVHALDDTYELYFVPTILVERLNQKSIALRRIEKLKNNYEMLEKCKNYEFVVRKCQGYGII
jgi:hypothetical protein